MPCASRASSTVNRKKWIIFKGLVVPGARLMINCPSSRCSVPEQLFSYGAMLGQLMWLEVSGFATMLKA
jgi:hypothetical protein